MEPNEWNKQHRDRMREANRRYRANHPERYRESQSKYREENPAIIKAHNIVNNRHIPLGPCCELCGSTENLQRAHFDYALPKMVLTLCSKHHGMIDAYLRRLVPRGTKCG